MLHLFLGLQDSFSLNMVRISELHDWAILIILAVVSVVGYMLVAIWWLRFTFSKFVESEALEIVWTFAPLVVLFLLSLVSLRTLYFLEEVVSPDLSVKVVGHQWYWSYECSALSGEEYSSYLVPTLELPLTGFRLLEVDKCLVLPMGLECRILVTSEDVVHSWAVPSLGVKLDGIPGRLNQLSFTALRSGILYGQCSEMCGTFHSFMPIKVEIFSV